MALSILNNISALMAENQLSATQTSLQKTLAQLSSGQRINTGADDAAGLAIANGLRANISALTQSVQNSTTGTGMLQVADGALSQVTSMLNRAVTLATEAANGTVAPGQFAALNGEFGKIVAEINSIGSNTYYNGTKIFNNAALTVYMGDGSQDMSVTTSTIPTLSATGIGLGNAATSTLYAIANAANNETVTIGSVTYTFKSAAPAALNQVQLGATLQDSLRNLADAVNNSGDATHYYTTGATANPDVSAVWDGNAGINFTAKDATVLGSTIASTTTSANLGFSSGTSFSGGGTAVDLSNATNAGAALTAVNLAVQTVAGYRGDIGAAINQLQAATGVINAQVQNLASSEDGIMAADIPSAVANMTKFNILQQTGMAALSQSNQMQQAVLKLLQ